MKSLVVFDMTSATGIGIAEAIRGGIDKCNALLCDPSDINLEEIEGLSLMIVGSPVIQNKASLSVVEFLENIPENVLSNISVTAFDTRCDTDNPKRSFFSVISEGDGNVAKMIAQKLRKKGGVPVIAPERFFVEVDRSIREEETARARNWGKLACRA